MSLKAINDSVSTKYYIATKIMQMNKIDQVRQVPLAEKINYINFHDLESTF